MNNADHIIPEEHMLTFVITDTTPLIYAQLPATSRTVHIKLTPEQLQQLKLKWCGQSGTEEHYEQVTSVIFEKKHKLIELDNKKEKLIASIQYLNSCNNQAYKMLDALPTENVIDRMSLEAQIASNNLSIDKLEDEVFELGTNYSLEVTLGHHNHD